MHTQSVGSAVVKHILLLAAGRYGPLVNGADYAIRYSKGTYGAVEIRLILRHGNGRGFVYHILKCNRELTAQRFRIVGHVQRSNQSACGTVQYLLAGLLRIGSGLTDVAVATAVVLYIRPFIIRTVRIVSTGCGLRALVGLCLKHIFHLTVRIAVLRQIFFRKGVLILGTQYHHECVIRGVIRRDFNALNGCVQSVFLGVDVRLILGQLCGGALYIHRALQQGFHLYLACLKHRLIGFFRLGVGGVCVGVLIIGQLHSRRGCVIKGQPSRQGVVLLAYRLVILVDHIFGQTVIGDLYAIGAAVQQNKLRIIRTLHQLGISQHQFVMQLRGRLCLVIRIRVILIGTVCRCHRAQVRIVLLGSIKGLDKRGGTGIRIRTGAAVAVRYIVIGVLIGFADGSGGVHIRVQFSIALLIQALRIVNGIAYRSVKVLNQIVALRHKLIIKRTAVSGVQICCRVPGGGSVHTGQDFHCRIRREPGDAPNQLVHIGTLELIYILKLLGCSVHQGGGAGRVYIYDINLGGIIDNAFTVIRCFVVIILFPIGVTINTPRYGIDTFR